MNYMIKKFEEKDGDYKRLAKLFGYFTDPSSKILKKCNLFEMTRTMLEKPSNELFNVLGYIRKISQPKFVICKTSKNFAILIEKSKYESNGLITCLDTDSNCKEASFNIKKFFLTFEYYSAFGCIDGNIFRFAFVSDEKIADSIKLYLKEYSSCVQGEKQKCSEELSKMNTKKRLLQNIPKDSCVPKMKIICNEVISKYCKESKLLYFIS